MIKVKAHPGEPANKMADSDIQAGKAISSKDVPISGMARWNKSNSFHVARASLKRR